MAEKPKEEPKEQEPSVPLCLVSATREDKERLWEQLVEVGCFDYLETKQFSEKRIDDFAVRVCTTLTALGCKEPRTLEELGRFVAPIIWFATRTERKVERSAAGQQPQIHDLTKEPVSSKKEFCERYRSLWAVTGDGPNELDEKHCDAAIGFCASLASPFGDFTTLHELGELLESFWAMVKTSREFLEPLYQIICHYGSNPIDPTTLFDSLSETERSSSAERFGGGIGKACLEMLLKNVHLASLSRQHAREAGQLTTILQGRIIADAIQAIIPEAKTILVELLTKHLQDDLQKVAPVYGGLTKVIEQLRSGEGLVDEPGVKSPAMRQTYVVLSVYAQTDGIVLLTGESGSGKDYWAKWIHEHSPRANGAYYSINCAALTPSLVESELFGYEKGAFNEAKQRKKGQLELANGGTLFMNEIGELSLQLQSKLLTFLDTKEFTRVGGTAKIKANARLIAATNRDLESEVKAGSFRNDLFYRLDVLRVEIPALKDRKEDLPDIVSQLLSPLAAREKTDPAPILSQEAMESLGSYHWPGNIRQLRNVLERAWTKEKPSIVLPHHLDIPTPDVIEPESAGPAWPDDGPGELASNAPTAPTIEKTEPKSNPPAYGPLPKPNREQLQRIYDECMVQGKFTIRDIATVFGRNDASTVTKWFREAGYDKFLQGRKPKSDRDLDELRAIVEAIMTQCL